MSAAPDPAAVREAGAADLRPVSLVLARAFRDDPVHRWILPGELDWALWSPGFFAMVMRSALRGAGAFTTDAHAGAALWFPPYPQPPPWGERLRTIARWTLTLGRRAGAVGRELARMERHHPAAPHWYLAVLGTDPRHQGRGVGSALLGPVLARCDADRTPAYLESSKRENIPFYERHGFRMQGEIAFRDGPTVWRMLREPVF